MPTNKRLSLRQMVAIGGITALLGLLLGATVLGPGAAIAQETSTTTSPDDSPGRDARQEERIRGALDELVEDGTITSDQADEVAAHLAGKWDFHGRRLHRLHAGLDVAATTIGITEADLVEALRGGQSVAEVAEENGVEVQAVIDALVAEVNSRVDEAVANGRLDEDRAAEIKANAVDRVTDFVNGVRPFRNGPSDNDA
ncbi:MAG: hypothetical protein ACRDWA_07800 [Acidimicrobiia bacterium]